MASRYYDKDELKSKLEIGQIYDLLELWGGEPEYNNSGLISQTICHNLPGQGSRKLYYYEGTQLFVCYTGCPESSFDIFDLCIKVKKNQEGKDWELYDAMDYIASYFGFDGIETERNDEQELEDWEIFKRHNQPEGKQNNTITLKEYNPIILTRFAYPHIISWEREGITAEVSHKNLIGYYPGGEQITIPHFDINGRLVGIRGRSLSEEDSNRYGKYRPLKIGKQLYNHPLSMNLYNLNRSKENIKRAKSAIIYEGEKSCLLHKSYFGEDNDISVACCGSNVSSYHIELLKRLGVNEIVIAFDRQFVEIGDNEFDKLTSKLTHIYKKYNNMVRITAVFDKHMITPYKASPIDEGPEVFKKLLRERIVPC